MTKIWFGIGVTLLIIEGIYHSLRRCLAFYEGLPATTQIANAADDVH